jgi:hypothetical protein
MPLFNRVRGGLLDDLRLEPADRMEAFDRENLASQLASMQKKVLYTGSLF